MLPIGPIPVPSVGVLLHNGTHTPNTVAGVRTDWVVVAIVVLALLGAVGWYVIGRR